MYQTVGEPRHELVCSRDGVTAGARMANPKSGPALNLEDYHYDEPESQARVIIPKKFLRSSKRATISTNVPFLSICAYKNAEKQPPARFSFLENSRDFFLIFTSRSRSRAIWVSLSTLEKEWKEFIFHFSLLEKSESYLNFTLFSREKRVKSDAGYDLTSLYLPKLYFLQKCEFFSNLNFTCASSSHYSLWLQIKKNNLANDRLLWLVATKK